MTLGGFYDQYITLRVSRNQNRMQNRTKLKIYVCPVRASHYPVTYTPSDGLWDANIVSLILSSSSSWTSTCFLELRSLWVEHLIKQVVVCSVALSMLSLLLNSLWYTLNLIKNCIYSLRPPRIQSLVHWINNVTNTVTLIYPCKQMIFTPKKCYVVADRYLHIYIAYFF